MKKLVTAACALAAGIAMADGVTSGNVVGYTTISFVAGQQYQLVGIPFESVANRSAVDANQGISVQDLFPDPIGQGFTAGNQAGLADRLQFWHNGGYYSLYLNTNTLPFLQNLKNKWINDGTPPDSTWGTSGQPSTKLLMPGEAFWIRRHATDPSTLPAKTLTIAGQVVVSDPVSRTISNQYTLLSGSFSAPFVPNPDIAKKDDGVTAYGAAIDWIGLGAHAGNQAGLADRLQFWTTSGSYFSLYLNTNTLPFLQNLKNKWINDGTPPDSTWGTSGQPSTVKIPAGVGFWYRRYDASEPAWTLPETQPYTL